MELTNTGNDDNI